MKVLLLMAGCLHNHTQHDSRKVIHRLIQTNTVQFIHSTKIFWHRRTYSSELNQRRAGDCCLITDAILIIVIQWEMNIIFSAIQNFTYTLSVRYILYVQANSSANLSSVRRIIRQTWHPKGAAVWQAVRKWGLQPETQWHGVGDNRRRDRQQISRQ